MTPGDPNRRPKQLGCKCYDICYHRKRVTAISHLRGPEMRPWHKCGGTADVQSPPPPPKKFG